MALRCSILAGLAASVALLAPATASSAPTAAPTAPRLWATINVCDTEGHPDGVGIRASMPAGREARLALFIRFQLQYLARRAREWRPVGRSGDAGFVAVGTGGPGRPREAGRTFTVTPPAAGRPAFLFRGLVTFEWRRDGAVVRRAHRLTSARHPDTVGSDPPGASAAVCAVR